MSKPFNNKEQHKTGVVLSGGSALGYAHIGALQAMEEYGIYPSVVSGVSMGAIIGLLYASGYTPKQIYEIVKKDKLYNVINLFAPNLKPNKFCLLNNNNILSIIKRYVKHNEFEKLQKPLYIAITNLSSGKIEYMSSGGKLFEGVIASATIPTLFETVKIADSTYIDGGVLNNMPSQPIRNLCKNLIGVNVYGNRIGHKEYKMKDIMLRTLQLVVQQNSKEGEDMCDALIYPKNEKYYEYSFRHFEKIYLGGYEATIAYFKQNEAIVEKMKKVNMVE